MIDSPWFVTTNRALWVEPCGGCGVALSRVYDDEALGQPFEQLSCALYGPVQFADEQLVFTD